MKVIKPTAITAAVLISTNVAELDTGETAWASPTAYAVGDLAARITTHRIYQRKVAGASADTPETDPVNWEDYLPTNRWAMFDQEVNTQSQRTSPLTVVLAPGQINSLALLELVGQQVEITMTSSAGGPTVYSRTVNLDTSLVTDWYQYWFEPFSQRSTLILSDLPPYLNCRVTITITGPGTVKCGQCIVGTLYSVGDTRRGITSGVRNYAKSKANAETTVVKLEKGKNRRSLRAKLEVPIGAETAIHQLLSGLLNTANVWLGDDENSVDPLVTFGFIEEFELDYQGKAMNYYSLYVQGMT